MGVGRLGRVSRDDFRAFIATVAVEDVGRSDVGEGLAGAVDFENALAFADDLDDGSGSEQSSDWSEDDESHIGSRRLFPCHFESFGEEGFAVFAAVEAFELAVLARSVVDIEHGFAPFVVHSPLLYQSAPLLGVGRLEQRFRRDAVAAGQAVVERIVETARGGRSVEAMAFDEILGLFQPQAGQRAEQLDGLDLHSFSEDVVDFVAGGEADACVVTRQMELLFVPLRQEVESLFAEGVGNVGVEADLASEGQERFDG